MRYCGKEGNVMVWIGVLDLIVVPTRWALLGVAISEVSVWTCGAGVGFTDRSVGRHPPVTYYR